MARAFRHRISVRFGDCDPAGIVYYPKFFDFFHQSMEAWFGAELGVPYARVIHRRKVGFPAVHTEADFKRPCFQGEEIDVALSVARLGETSVDLRFAVVGAGDEAELPRLMGRTVCVVVCLDSDSEHHLRPVPVPPDLRTAIDAFMRG